MSKTPRYLTGDKQGIKEFLDKFDVRCLDHQHRCPTMPNKCPLVLYSL
jgi:hypothetical protein